MIPVTATILHSQNAENYRPPTISYDAQFLKDRNITTVLSSPYYRSWHSAQQLVKATAGSMKIDIEPLLSEDRQLGPPDVDNEYWHDGSTNEALESALLSEASTTYPQSHYSVWGTEGEQDHDYYARVKAASYFLKGQLSRMSGNVAMFSHATTCLTLAYGLCSNLYGGNLGEWFENYVQNNIPAGDIPRGIDLETEFPGESGIGGGGIIRIVFRAGKCVALYPVDNRPLYNTDPKCAVKSATRPHKFPKECFYWEPSKPDPEGCSKPSSH
jgi:hypothetical protein